MSEQYYNIIILIFLFSCLTLGFVGFFISVIIYSILVKLMLQIILAVLYSFFFPLLIIELLLATQKSVNLLEDFKNIIIMWLPAIFLLAPHLVLPYIEVNFFYGQTFFHDDIFTQEMLPIREGLQNYVFMRGGTEPRPLGSRIRAYPWQSHNETSNFLGTSRLRMIYKGHPCIDVKNMTFTTDNARINFVLRALYNGEHQSKLRDNADSNAPGKAVLAVHEIAEIKQITAQHVIEKHQVLRFAEYEKFIHTVFPPQDPIKDWLLQEIRDQGKQLSRGILVDDNNLFIKNRLLLVSNLARYCHKHSGTSASLLLASFEWHTSEIHKLQNVIRNNVSNNNNAPVLAPAVYDPPRKYLMSKLAILGKEILKEQN